MLVFLVDAVICQVRENIFKIASVVFFAGETAQALFEDVDAQGVYRSDSNIDTQIPFVAIDQQWIRDILLHDAGRLASSSWNLFKARNDLDTFTLRRCFGLHNPKLARLLSHLGLKLLVLLWAAKGQRHEIEVLTAIQGLHA